MPDKKAPKTTSEVEVKRAIKFFDKTIEDFWAYLYKEDSLKGLTLRQFKKVFTIYREFLESQTEDAKKFLKTFPDL